MADTDDLIVARVVARSKAEILEDVRTGVVPPDVRDFGTLHDYVDANCYGGMCEADCPIWSFLVDGEPPTADEDPRWVDLASRIQDEVHQWLVAGGLDGAPYPVCVCGHAQTTHERAPHLRTHSGSCEVDDCDCTAYDPEKEN